MVLRKRKWKKPKKQPLTLLEMFERRQRVKDCLQATAVRMLAAKGFKAWSTLHDEMTELLVHLNSCDEIIDKMIKLSKKHPWQSLDGRRVRRVMQNRVIKMINNSA